MKSRFALCGALVLALAACKTSTVAEKTNKPEAVPVTPSAPSAALLNEDKLADRAVNRWKLIIAGKYDQAYEYLTPGYRQTRNRKDYGDVLANRPVRWTDAAFYDQACSAEDVCTVKINIFYEINMPVAGVGTVPATGVLEEKWLKIDGAWFFLPTSGGGIGSGR
jgi:hypothetical protein